MGKDWKSWEWIEHAAEAGVWRSKYRHKRHSILLTCILSRGHDGVFWVSAYIEYGSFAPSAAFSVAFMTGQGETPQKAWDEIIEKVSGNVTFTASLKKRWRMKKAILK